MAFFVYILRCSDGSFYTGHTDNLVKRQAEHASGETGGYTATRRPVKLLFTQEFSTREEALGAEQQIKGWSRKKKKALIAGDWRRFQDWRGAAADENIEPPFDRAQGERL